MEGDGPAGNGLLTHRARGPKGQLPLPAHHASVTP